MAYGERRGRVGKLSVVVGGMFGSEAKGHLTADLASAAINNGETVTVVRVAGHNAGHSACDSSGRVWALRTIPAAAVNPQAQLVIAAGSEVDPRVLVSEIQALEAGGFSIRGRLTIDPAATWLEQRHIDTECAAHMNERTGSTAKGVGAARADRVMRTARLLGEWDELAQWATVAETGPMLTASAASESGHVIVEGTQGAGLSLHGPHYPLTTSSSCRAIDFLAMASISPWGAVPAPNVWVVIRPYPIRVAGPSGELKGETSWDALGLETELTTVTKRPRRVGSWDPELVRYALQQNGGGLVALSMLDQVFPEVSGVTCSRELSAPAKHWLGERAEEIGSDIRWVGTGPSTSVFLH